MAIAAGDNHSVALKNDGTVVAWGDNRVGQTSEIAGLTNVKLIAAGGDVSMASVFSPLVQYTVNVANDLLLIYNTNSMDSSNVMSYYLANRPMVANANVLGIGYTNSASPGYYETINLTDLTNLIFTPVLNWLGTNSTKRPEYVLLFLDVPSRVDDTNTYPTGGGYPGPGPWNHPSVSVQLQSISTGWHPLATHINMNGINDCTNYINKLVSFGSNYCPGKLIISASAGGYGNTNYYFDDTGILGVTSNVSGVNASNAVVLAGASPASVTYTNVTDGGLIDHITNGVNVSGYMSFGAHSSLGVSYATNVVVWSGNSAWWIIETVESYNGRRYETDMGTFMEWFSSNAFGGMSYTKTPIGAVSNVDEPSESGINDAATYFGLWEARKNFAICAWNSRITSFFQAVGDPFITK